VLEFLEVEISTSEYDYDGCWAHFAFAAGTDEEVFNTSVSLFVNNELVGSAVSEYVIFANRNVDFHIGSTFG
jgi:hypothetical protein